MRIVVTGATGLIGSHLTASLLAHSHDVVALCSARTDAAPDRTALAADITSEEARSMARGADAIVHLAGLSDASLSLADPVAYARVNASGTMNMLEAARQWGCHLILASSQRVYRPNLAPLKETDDKLPADPYGYTKLVSEMWCEMYSRFYGVRSTVLRFFSVYGDGQRDTGGSSGVVGIFTRNARAGRPLIVRSNALRDFTHVDDVVAGIEATLAYPGQYGVFNIATGIALSIEDLAREVAASVSPSPEVVVDYGPDNDSFVADITQARQLLGFTPKVSLREGLRAHV